jgi:hypothetical protein
VTEMLSGLSDADLTGVYESLDTLREAARQYAESEGLQGGRSRAASVPQR